MRIENYFLFYFRECFICKELNSLIEKLNMKKNIVKKIQNYNSVAFVFKDSFFISFFNILSISAKVIVYSKR